MPVPEQENLIAAEGLHVSLGGLPVLSDVSIQLRAGEAVAILGSNGSGKTTLLRTLLRLIPFQGGSIELFGTPIHAFRHWHRVGYVPQHATLNVQNATVREVVALGRLAHQRPFGFFTRRDRNVVAESLDRVGLLDRAHWPFAPLSGGMKQRVLIARALAAEPDLLIMDEPLAGLDTDTQARLTELFGSLRSSGVGLGLVLHEIEVVAPVLDRFIRLSGGHVLDSADTSVSEPWLAARRREPGGSR
ncbi:MAG: ATP-binding cassette domain-containing protein [Propionibacteriaceae bacterium]|nr:ATP-binding cassette domain-containing protein [Propionibacteriaceae bacterium]